MGFKKQKNNSRNWSTRKADVVPGADRVRVWDR